MADRKLLALVKTGDEAMQSALEAELETRESSLRVARGGSVEEMQEHLQPGRDVAVLLLGVSSRVLDDLLLEAEARRTQVHFVQTTSAGVDYFLSPTVRASSVPLCRVPNVFNESLAEFALAGCLYFAKRMPELLAAKGSREWRKHQVRDLRGARLGVVGYGGIGRAIGRIAHEGFGMRVTGLRRRPELTDIRRDPAESVVGVDGLRELLRECTYVALAAPLTGASRAMLGADELALMRSDAVLVNVGRGSLIDEAALVRHLQGRRIAGAVLDVFETEPLPAASLLWALDNVLISAHTADDSVGWQSRALQRAFENVDRWLDGLSPLYEVDKEIEY